MGRPSSYTEEIAAEICARLISEPLYKICADDGMPDRGTVNRWMLANADFAAKCARAREIRAADFVEQTVEIADEPVPSNNFGGLDGGAVQNKKVRIAARQWYAEKIDPKRFGQKVAIGGADDLPPVKTLGDEALAERIKQLQEKVNGGK